MIGSKLLLQHHLSGDRFPIASSCALCSPATPISGNWGRITEPDSDLTNIAYTLQDVLSIRRHWVSKIAQMSWGRASKGLVRGLLIPVPEVILRTCGDEECQGLGGRACFAAPNFT